MRSGSPDTGEGSGEEGTYVRRSEAKGTVRGHRSDLSIGAPQDEVAELFGMTRARVSQIERSAIRKLRRVLAAEPDRYAEIREAFEHLLK